MPTLYIFSGLPGTGKTTLSRRLAQHRNAACVRIDTIEQAIRDLCDITVEGEGYQMAYRIARDNLALGLDVVADSCNTIYLTRREWEKVAVDNSSTFVNIEVRCEDPAEHQHRIENRAADIAGHQLPDWTAVTGRQYDPWKQGRIIVDTSGKTIDNTFDYLLQQIERHDGA